MKKILYRWPSTVSTVAVIVFIGLAIGASYILPALWYVLIFGLVAWMIYSSVKQDKRARRRRHEDT